MILLACGTFPYFATARYTPELKQQIVELYNAGGTSYPQPEREYGVNRSTLSNWVKLLSLIKVSGEETVTLKEYKSLLKENRRLKIENEILKKRPPYSYWLSDTAEKTLILNGSPRINGDTSSLIQKGID